MLHTYLVYNTVVRLCQFFGCGGKVNFVQIPYSHDHFSKISRIFFVNKLIPYKTYEQEDQLSLALYGSSIIQSRLFLKNIENFVWFPKQYLLGFFLLEKQLANILDRGCLFLRNTLYSTLLALTHRQNHRRRNKYTRFLWAGGNFFQLCCCFSFLFWWEIGFGFTYYLCT